MNKPLSIEIERKFLIKLPSVAKLEAIKGIRIKHIEQTYLTSTDDESARVRLIREDEAVRFIKTVKKRISALSCYEDECEISSVQYAEELKKADPKRNTIKKTRYAFPFGTQTIEIDVYPFWDDRAILEIELKSEDDELHIPDFLKVVKEVSDDSRYKNASIALKIPSD